MARFEERPRIEAMNREHMSVVLAVDTSGSVAGEPPRQINANLNRFKECVCEDPVAASCVDVCVIAFDDEPRVIQDWVPVSQMQPIELTSGGLTDLNGAVLLAVEKLRERSREYAANGVLEKKPYLIVMTDGQDNVTGAVSEAAALVTRRTNEGKLKLFFLGYGAYDRTAAAQLTEANGRWCFQVRDGCFDFHDFFDFVGNSVKAVSVSAPGERVSVPTNINSDISNVQTVDLDSWLSD